MPRLLRFTVVGAASALIVAACGGGIESTPASGTPNGTGAPAGVDCPTIDYCALRCGGKDTPLYPAQCTIPPCSCLVGTTPRSDWAGTYFLPDKVDATNLVLESDGTFRWTIDGCDFGGGDCGTWKKSQPHTIVLLPAASHTDFQWAGSAGVTAMRELNVVSDASGELVMELPFPGGKPLAQRWKHGRVCAICGGSAGPSGQQPCTEPVERRCR